MAQNTDLPVIRLLLGPWAPAISSLFCSSLDGSSSSVEFVSPLLNPVFSAAQRDAEGERDPGAQEAQPQGMAGEGRGSDVGWGG